MVVSAWHTSKETERPPTAPPSRPTPSSLLSLFPSALPCLSPRIADTFVKWCDFSFMQALLKSNKQSIVDKETRQDKDFRLKL